MRLSDFVLWMAISVSATGQTRPMAAAGAQDADIQPPATARLVMAARAEGVQIYRCEAKDGGWAWVLQGPEATLIGTEGQPVGKHFAGPAWQLEDGSEVQGTLLASQKQVTAIPWLLLSAKSTGRPGGLSGVAFVRRTDTVGGLPPAVGCDALHPHAETRSTYAAKYSFYAAN